MDSSEIGPLSTVIGFTTKAQGPCDLSENDFTAVIQQWPSTQRKGAHIQDEAYS